MANPAVLAEMRITYESGHVVTATLNPEKAEKTLRSMKAGSICRPLPDFKDVLISQATTEPV